MEHTETIEQWFDSHRETEFPECEAFVLKDLETCKCESCSLYRFKRSLEEGQEFQSQQRMERLKELAREHPWYRTGEYESGAEKAP